MINAGMMSLGILAHDTQGEWVQPEKLYPAAELHIRAVVVCLPGRIMARPRRFSFFVQT